MSSRLVRNGTGKPQYAVITTPDVVQPVGVTFAVIGDDLTEVAIGWTGTPTGRPPQPEEMTGAPHAGSEYLYARGCRCEPCRRAATEARRARRLRDSTLTLG